MEKEERELAVLGGYYALVATSLYYCGLVPKDKKDLDSRLDIDKRLVQMFCDCDDKFEFNKLCKKIKLCNQEFQKKIWYLR